MASMPIPNHELLAKVERLEARIERLECLEISSDDLEEHLARLKRLEGFMDCIESYLDRLEQLSGPLSRLEERLEIDGHGRQPSRSKSSSKGFRLVQSKVEAKAFLARLARSTSDAQRSFSFKRWFLRLFEKR